MKFFNHRGQIGQAYPSGMMLKDFKNRRIYFRGGKLLYRGPFYLRIIIFLISLSMALACTHFLTEIKLVNFENIYKSTLLISLFLWPLCLKKKFMLLTDVKRVNKNNAVFITNHLGRHYRIEFPSERLSETFIEIWKNYAELNPAKIKKLRKSTPVFVISWGMRLFITVIGILILGKLFWQFLQLGPVIFEKIDISSLWFALLAFALLIIILGIQGKVLRRRFRKQPRPSHSPSRITYQKTEN